ncbi:MAG: ribbon-helix-helix protein, CopG family [Promethearchaeota archaeon]
MRTMEYPYKRAVTVYLTDKEISIIEKKARREERSRTQQIRVMLLKDPELANISNRNHE